MPGPWWGTSIAALPRLIATVMAFARLTTQTSATRPSPANDAFSFPLATDTDTGKASAEVF